MKTLKVCNKSFVKKHEMMILPHELLEKGLALVKEEGADIVAELVCYGQKVKGMALPESIASARSWQKVIIGLIAHGPNAYDLEKIGWCAYSAPYEGMLAITMLLKDRPLPVDWMENAIRNAHYSVKSYEQKIYAICKNADHDTVVRWLASNGNPWWQIAGICACAEAETELEDEMCIECAKAYIHLVENPARFKDDWLYDKFIAAMSGGHTTTVEVRKDIIRLLYNAGLLNMAGL